MPDPIAFVTKNRAFDFYIETSVKLRKLIALLQGMVDLMLLFHFLNSLLEKFVYLLHYSRYLLGCETYQSH